MAPDSRGLARDLYGDGGLKAKGRIRDGELHGDWQWWRQDGSLMRSGTFDRGRQVREWTTYDRDGAPAKVTDFGR
jgi:antitoxin component YwqK of YwqJK toxin-antitoxin module